MKKTITKLMAALALLLFVAPPLVGWGQTRTEKVTYTLDGTQTGGNNGYATESEITQGNITWMVTGNTTMNPWRIGGKNLSEVDRPLYSTSTLSDDITKVVVTNGTATATVNSMTLIVSANSDFSNPTSTVSGTWAASSTTTFERPANTDWSNMYFKLVYNVTAGSSNQYAQFVKAEFYKLGDTSIPSIEADNVSIVYDATEGAIEYTINNGVEGGVLTAATEAEWLTIGTVGETVPFTCTVNSDGERVATVALTYIYNTDQTVTKNVTVTQASDPNYVMTIAEARALTDGTTVLTSGIVTSKNGTTSYIQDATGAIVVYNSNDPVVGHYITVEGVLTTFKGLREIGTSSNAPTVTVGEEGTVTPTVMTIEAINTDASGSNSHQAKLVRIENAIYNNGIVYQGENNITVYGTMTGVNDNDVVTFTANIGCYNTVQLVNMTDITVQAVPSIAINPATVNVDANGHEEYLAINLQNIEVTDESNFEIYFYESDGTTTADYSEWLDAEVIPSTNEGYEVYCVIQANTGEARQAYLKVYVLGDDSNEATSELVTINQAAYEAPAETWVLTDLADLTEGDVFVIVGDNGDTYAMPNDNGTSSAPAAVAIDVVNGTLSEAPAANLQWNLSRQGNSYTFYPNGDAENWLYCTNANNGIKVGVGSAHHFTLSDNGYLTTTETTVQRYLGIYNSQDWRCYTSEGGNIANQTFAFYKKNVSTQTYNLTINGYGQSEGGYRLIASPVYVNPENTGMITDDGTDPENYTYDFYFFDQAQEDEWRNYRQEAFNLVPGKGYLYASQESTTLTFTGTPYSGDGSVSLVKDNNAVWSGWNLVGNPFGETAYIDRDFYAMNEDGSDIMTNARQGAVAAMQGIFVIAENNGETLTFTTETPAQEEANVTLNLTQNRGTVIDRAIVRFGEGRQLPKFQLNAESTKLYIPQADNDYAVVRSAAQGEMPVNFKASKNGSYTIAINAKNVEVGYLHLIDNMTGADVDLLASPSYSFEAKTTDYANRFRLVFNITSVEDNTTSTEPFAFFNGSVWCISNMGEATLQVVDLLGRIVSSESINGNTTLSTTNLKDGVYMFRLVNGENVKVQKVVVK